MTLSSSKNLYLKNLLLISKIGSVGIFVVSGTTGLLADIFFFGSSGVFSTILTTIIFIAFASAAGLLLLTIFTSYCIKINKMDKKSLYSVAVMSAIGNQVFLLAILFGFPEKVASPEYAAYFLLLPATMGSILVLAVGIFYVRLFKQELEEYMNDACKSKQSSDKPELERCYKAYSWLNKSKEN